MRTLVLVCLLLVGCGTSPYKQEYDAFRQYLEAEVRAGRMSLEEGNYRLASKRNELLSRQQSDLANSAAMGAYGIGLINAAGPRPMANPTMNCTSIQQGAFVNTSCH